MIFQHIFVPMDGSRLSEVSAVKAVEMAKESGARITAFHAKPTYLNSPLGESSIFHSMTQDTFDKVVEKEAAKVLDFITARCAEAGVPCDTITIDSDFPAEAIVQASARCGADLIFMATNGRKGIKGMLIGSETRKVINFSKIPVLVHR